MTYEELQVKIMSMTDEQKKMHVTVCVDGEYFGACHLVKSQADDVLDKEHPFLEVSTLVSGKEREE